MTHRLAFWALTCLALLAALQLEPTPVGRPAPSLRLPAFAALTEIRVARRDWPTVALRPTPAGWVVRTGAGPGAAPAPTSAEQPASASAIAQIAAALEVPLGADQAVTPTAGLDLDPYGIGPHAPTVTLETTEGNLSIRLGKVVGNRRTWAQGMGDDAQLWRIEGNLRRVFERPPEAWIERRLLPATAADSVARLTRYDGPNPVWSVQRTAPEGPWAEHETRSIGAVNPLAATATLGALLSAQAEAFEPASAPALLPVRRLVAETFDGQRFGLVLEVGTPSRAQRIDGGPVARIPSWLADALAIGAAELRQVAAEADPTLTPADAGPVSPPRGP